MTEAQAENILVRIFHHPHISGFMFSVTSDAAGEWGVDVVEILPGKPHKHFVETDYLLVLRELGLGTPMEE